MKKIPLSNSRRFALMDDRDYKRVSERVWRLHVSPNELYYAITGSAKRWNSMHSFVMNTRRMIDHRDCNGLNNRTSNLRVCNASQNQANRRKVTKGTSKYKGVFLEKRSSKWIAKIRYDGFQMCIGSFSHEEEAAIAYNIAAKQLFGKFARLNQIKGEK